MANRDAGEMKIGVLVKPTISNAIYRAVAPMLALGECGHEVVLVKRGDDGLFSPRQLVGCDVVHVYRGADEPRVCQAVDDLHRRGIAITWDDDDDVRLIPSDVPGYKSHYGGLNVQRRIGQQIAMTSRADVVTTTTQALAELFGRDFDGPTEVIESYLNSSQYARDGRKHDGITIGWVASLEHVTDVRMLDVTSMLRNVMARNEDVRVTTVGVKLDLDPDRYTHVRRIKFEELSKFVAKLDIGIAPIADHPMSYARSNVKVKEYSAAGVPWVASARGPYAGLGTREGGITVADDRWEETLLDLAGSRLKRMRLRRKASSWGKSQHIRHHTQRWEAVMQMAVEAAASRDGSRSARVRGTR
jgi:glycosyltransferase involved in cell wall biosynthesis